MSGNYPDGVGQAEFDRAHEEMDDERSDDRTPCRCCERCFYEEQLVEGLCEDCSNEKHRLLFR